MADQKEILFVCIENSSRSQMAEGFTKARGIKASSAGTVPSVEINPLAVQVMQEEGIDISNNRTKQLTSELAERADIVVLTDATLEDAIPNDIKKKISKKLVYWSVPNPHGEPIEVVRYIRDSIKKHVNLLIEKEMKN